MGRYTPGILARWLAHLVKVDDLPTLQRQADPGARSLALGQAHVGAAAQAIGRQGLGKASARLLAVQVREVQRWTHQASVGNFNSNTA